MTKSFIGIAVVLTVVGGALTGGARTVAQAHLTQPAGTPAGLTIPAANLAPTSISVATLPLSVQGRQVLFSGANVHLTPNAWSPDGQRVLFNKLTDQRTAEAVDPKRNQRYAVGIYELWQYSLATGQQTKLADNGFAGSWSTDGKRVRYIVHNPDGRSVEGHVRDMVSGKDTDLGKSEALWLSYLAGGQAVTVRGGLIIVQQPNGLVALWPNASITDSHYGLFWPAPDGSALLIAEGSNLVLVTRGGQQMRLATDYQYGRSYVAWSPDSKNLVYLSPPTGQQPSTNAQVRIYNVTSGKTTTLMTAAAWNEELLSPDWSPDGRIITFTRQQRRSGVPASLWAIGVEGTGLQKVADDVVTAYWAPDGRHLLVQQASTARQVSLITLR